MRVFRSAGLVLAGVMALGPVNGDEPGLRVWKSKAGSEVSASLLRLYVDGKTPMAILKTQAGKEIRLRVDQLSEGDQDHIYENYADSFGSAAATKKDGEMPEKPAADDEDGFKIEVKRRMAVKDFEELDINWLHDPPAGARISRDAIPITGERDNGDPWLERLLVNQAIWWAKCGLLYSRNTFKPERLEKEMWREFGGTIEGKSWQLASVADSMNKLLERRRDEVKGVKIQYLSKVTPEQLAAAAKGAALVAVEVKVYDDRDRYQWQGPALIVEASDDGKLKIALWDEISTVTMVPLPQEKWVEAPREARMRARERIPPYPVYKLVFDPADTSENKQHVEDEGFELRIESDDESILVYSPKFTPKPRE